RQGGLPHHIRPIEQEVVVIEDVIALFRFDISAKQAFQLGLPLSTPGKGNFQSLCQWAARVDSVRIDGEARVLAREAGFRCREPQLVADKVQPIRRVGAIKDRERWIEPDAIGVFAEESVANRVESAGPRDLTKGSRTSRLFAGARPGEDALRSAGHFRGRAACKG